MRGKEEIAVHSSAGMSCNGDDDGGGIITKEIIQGHVLRASFQQQTIDEITSESQMRIGMSSEEISRIHLIKLKAKLLRKLLKLMLCINFFHYS